VDTKKVDTLANHLITKLNLEQRTTREQLLFVDSQVGRHIEQAFKETQKDYETSTPVGEIVVTKLKQEAEFKLAVYLRVWSEITVRLLTL